MDENFAPTQKFTLKFLDANIEKDFQRDYDSSIRLPLLQGIVISIISWFSATGLVFSIIPEEASWLVPLTLVYIGSYFGFIVYVTLFKKLQGYYQLLGAISNAWAGLFAIYFCHQFPNGAHLTLPVLIFIIFFGSYMVRLRWLAGSMAGITYTVSYCIYLIYYSDLSFSQIELYIFVIWMTFIFSILAGRNVEMDSRLRFVQRKIISDQNAIINHEKQILLQEVHHRVKNNLQLIISLINLELSKQDRTLNYGTLKKIQSRVLSMSLIHNLLNVSTNFETVNLAEFIQSLLDRSKTNISLENNFQYHLDIPDQLVVDIDKSIPLAVLLNEVVLNFIDHVSTETDAFFEIRCELIDNDKLKILYKDNGPGIKDSVNIESEDCLGLELISLLSDQLDGDFKFHNDNGAVYTITCKLNTN